MFSAVSSLGAAMSIIQPTFGSGSYEHATPEFDVRATREARLEKYITVGQQSLRRIRCRVAASMLMLGTIGVIAYQIAWSQAPTKLVPDVKPRSGVFAWYLQIRGPGHGPTSVVSWEVRDPLSRSAARRHVRDAVRLAH